MSSAQQFSKQLKFIAYYLDVLSRTHSNLHRSALRAGYGDAYARKIGSQLDWELMEAAIKSVSPELERIVRK